MKIRIEFTEELLGTASNNKEIQREFIASKAPDAATVEEEVAAVGVDEVVEKGMTVFPREDGKPFLYNYQVKGFLKEACKALARVPGTRSNKMKAYIKVIDGLVFVFPRKIFFTQPQEIGGCQRPLRAQTAQGERIALANSEKISGGAAIECEIRLLDAGHEAVVKEWLDYGALRGMGCWRNSGKGTFQWSEIE